MRTDEPPPTGEKVATHRIEKENVTVSEAALPTVEQHLDSKINHGFDHEEPQLPQLPFQVIVAPSPDPEAQAIKTRPNAFKIAVGKVAAFIKDKTPFTIVLTYFVFSTCLCNSMLSRCIESWLTDFQT